MPKIHLTCRGKAMLKCGHEYSFLELGLNGFTDLDEFSKRDHECPRCKVEGRIGIPMDNELSEEWNQYNGPLSFLM